MCARAQYCCLKRNNRAELSTFFVFFEHNMHVQNTATVTAIRHMMYYREHHRLVRQRLRVSASGPPYFPERLFSSTTVPWG